MDWDKLKVFHAVAEAGSFTHAGEVLNLSQSAISRQVGALEESLHVTLFHRHARGLIKTEQGDLLYRAVRDVFAKLAIVEAQLSESRDRPTGLLRVTTTVAMGSIWLTPRIREFHDLCPEITLEFVLDDRELDLAMREADVAIRMMAPRQPELIQRHLMTVRLHIYGSPAYLEKHGTPLDPADLDAHQLIVYGGDLRFIVTDPTWLLKIGAKRDRPRRPILTINNTYAMLLAVQSGLGLAALPDYVAQTQPGLVRVLPTIDGPQVDAYFVYSEELRDSKRIEVFREFLLRQVAQSSF